jgi:prepilin-type N-terminal cleavage/methylation domain-containing protein
MRTQNRHAEQGFSLIELMLVIAITGAVMAMAIMVSPSFMRFARADAGSGQMLEILRSARESAIAQRRNIEVRFIGTNTVQTARIEFPSLTKTILRTVQLENRMQFLIPSGVSNTPDLFVPFDATVPVSFGLSASRMFTSEGTFVDASGDVLNGSIFISAPGDATSARAISIFGTTALLHAWRWNGTKWIE